MGLNLELWFIGFRVLVFGVAIDKIPIDRPDYLQIQDEMSFNQFDLIIIDNVTCKT